MLQALLRGPVNVIALDPQLPDDRANFAKATVLRGVGPGQAGFDELNRLFERNGITVGIDGLAASKNTWGDRVVVSGLQDKISFALAQLAYSSDGFQSNDDVRQNSYDALVPTQLSSTPAYRRKSVTSLTGETFSRSIRIWSRRAA
jgi:hypothetical protein